MDRVQFLQSLDGWDLHSEIREGWDWEFHNCVVFSQTMLQSVSIGSTFFFNFNGGGTLANDSKCNWCKHILFSNQF